MNDDTGLIAAVAAGDDMALRELLSRHGPWLAARRAISSQTRCASSKRPGSRTVLPSWRNSRQT